jgi:PKD repeat protein
MFRLFRRSASRRAKSRGQSLVEFALALPLMLLLMLIALDFGRVYLGWINLQNMTRIAANYAANNPTAWSKSDAAAKLRYQNQINEDAKATNCQLPLVAGVRTAPDPTFTDANADGTSTSIGDTATVRLSCSFGVITPFISSIIGGSVSVGSSAVFPVKAGMSRTGGPSGTPAPAPNAAFTGNGTINTTAISGPSPFTVTFRDTSGGGPTSWSWDFMTGIPATSTAQDPLNVVFTNPGTYTATMIATNLSGSSTATMTVTVTAAIGVDFTMTPPSGNAPLTVQFADTSTFGGASPTWTFGTGEGTGTGWTTSHTYNTVGTYTVTHTVTYPIIGSVSRTKTISIGAGLCTVPNLHIKRNGAPGVWTTAGFTGSLTDGPAAPGGNYTITTQSLTAASSVPCSSSVVVNDH